jgi:hypothetical protein
VTTWYHGGIPGLRAGDRILPPDETGTDHRLSAHAPAEAPHGHRTDVVYLTNSQQAARVYAALYPDGALYQVEPETTIEPDPDAPALAAMATSAVVTAVIRPRVALAHRRLDSWIRMLTTAEETR